MYSSGWRGLSIICFIPQDEQLCGERKEERGGTGPGPGAGQAEAPGICLQTSDWSILNRSGPPL
jgi:hypothetical protein